MNCGRVVSADLSQPTWRCLRDDSWPPNTSFPRSKSVSTAPDFNISVLNAPGWKFGEAQPRSRGALWPIFTPARIISTESQDLLDDGGELTKISPRKSLEDEQILVFRPGKGFAGHSGIFALGTDARRSRGEATGIYCSVAERQMEILDRILGRAAAGELT